ncbi:hypothetical protein [Mesorhizobium sp. B2-3-15]|uniref:hypothetical protein n=1 Tax=Mesorhizobium sp. B2-3-15 TaxID=2589949 RepID=UPI00112E784E|nr:hypothetical protein [Mesorhizobium sp. B2-3-15]TPL71534.1 hypothetical protein FJ954_18285 [Mesorhizobium sp. B2-3-15]
MLKQVAQATTSFVFVGGDSFGAIQGGMLRSLARHGNAADMGCRGTLNEVYYPGDPTMKESDGWRRSGVDCGGATHGNHNRVMYRRYFC